MAAGSAAARGDGTSVSSFFWLPVKTLEKGTHPTRSLRFPVKTPRRRDPPPKKQGEPGTQKPRCQQIFVNDCQRTACPRSLQEGARGRHRQTDNAAIAAAWIMPFCYGPLRAPRTIGSLQAAKALRWQPCTDLQASDQSKRNEHPGRGSRNYIVATSHGLSRFLGASCGLCSAKGRVPSTCPKGITSCERARSLCLFDSRGSCSVFCRFT